MIRWSSGVTSACHSALLRGTSPSPRIAYSLLARAAAASRLFGPARNHVIPANIRVNNKVLGKPTGKDD